MRSLCFHGRTHKVSYSLVTLGFFTLVVGCQSESKLASELKEISKQIGSSAPASPSPTSSPSVTPSPQPSTLPTPQPQAIGELNPACMTSSSYDACIFFKNPVAQNQASLSPSLTPSSNLSKLQIFGVKLKDLSSSGYLENSSFVITPGGSRKRVQKNSDGSWKFAFSSNCQNSTCTADPDHKVGQLMAYFWLNHQADWMTENTGKFYAKNKSIPVQTYYSNLYNAYWDGSAIIMGDGGSSKAEFALSAEVYLHEAGHANLSYAAAGTLYGTSQCNSAKGCISGINEGQADYHAAIIFPENGAILGESAVNSVQGLTECGLSRSLAANKNTTAQQAYSACSSNLGEVHLMGRVYASVWWEIRNKSTSNPREVDQLFTEHLKSLQNSDTFETALTKIKSIDKALFRSKYSADFTDEFGRRGISG